jgi:hypothetical protein
VNWKDNKIQNKQNMPALDNEKLIYSQLVDRYKPSIEKASSEVIIDNLEVSVDWQTSVAIFKNTI